jgi:NAD(P)-dependent dehydrogenase (short-subunit alcohol dehydrogenase family)
MTSASVPATSTVLSRLPDPRTAVVTGAGSPAGIGRATARALAESGWHVALVDINAEGLADVEQELRQRVTRRCLHCRATLPPSPQSSRSISGSTPNFLRW